MLWFPDATNCEVTLKPPLQYLVVLATFDSRRESRFRTDEDTVCNERKARMLESSEIDPNARKIGPRTSLANFVR